jgi:hypothetical protein
MRYLIIVALLFTGCTDFTRNVGQVDDDMVRTISFSYENAELKPGDTATLYATFAGDSINISSIVWSVSWDVFTNPFGENIAYNEQPLSYKIEEVDSSITTANTQVVKISFLIPDSIVRTSSTIPDEWKSIIFLYGVEPDSISPEYYGAIAALPNDKNEMIDLIEAMAENPSLLPDEVKELIEPICQLFTVNFNIYAKGITDYDFKKSGSSVRYQSAFDGYAPVYLDTKPQMDTIMLYHLEGEWEDHNEIQFHKAIDSFPIYNSKDTIDIPFNDGESYSIEFVQKLDTTLTINEALKKNGSTSLEKYDWRSFRKGSDTTISLIETISDNDTTLSFIIEGKKGAAATTFWIKANSSRFGVVGWPSSIGAREITIRGTVESEATPTESE